MLTLIDDIKEIQVKYNLSDQKFAKKLGVDPTNFSRIKRGLRNPGRQFLSALSQNFPELDLKIMQYMKGKEVN